MAARRAGNHRRGFFIGHSSHLKARLALSTITARWTSPATRKALRPATSCRSAARITTAGAPARPLKRALIPGAYRDGRTCAPHVALESCLSAAPSARATVQQSSRNEIDASMRAASRRLFYTPHSARSRRSRDARRGQHFSATETSEVLLSELQISKRTKNRIKKRGSRTSASPDDAELRSAAATHQIRQPDALRPADGAPILLAPSRAFVCQSSTTERYDSWKARLLDAWGHLPARPDYAARGWLHFRKSATTPTRAGRFRECPATGDEISFGDDGLLNAASSSAS